MYKTKNYHKILNTYLKMNSSKTADLQFLILSALSHTSITLDELKAFSKTHGYGENSFSQAWTILVKTKQISFNSKTKIVTGLVNPWNPN